MPHTPSPPFEDGLQDVIGKALRGLKISPEGLARMAGLSVPAIEEILSGVRPALPVVRSLAGVLDLHPEALCALASGTPGAPEPPMPVDLFRAVTPYGPMMVNAYVAWDASTREAVVFDSGADAAPLLEFLASHSLNVRAILLTHTHVDHVTDIPRIVAVTGADVWVSEKEPFANARPFKEGKIFTCGKLGIETRLTTGHSTGGTSYILRGGSATVAVVGDALFARSMGGAKVSYEDALRTNRQKLFSLPGHTIIAPGHGPLSTIADELVWNPFFAPRH